jgi:signal transduction histidine kinase
MRLRRECVRANRRGQTSNQANCTKPTSGCNTKVPTQFVVSSIVKLVADERMWEFVSVQRQRPSHSRETPVAPPLLPRTISPWSDPTTPMTTITLVAALFSLALTFLVLWANPHRFSNQVFALVLLVQTGWLACVYRAMQIGADPIELDWWFRANAVVISFLPSSMWLLKCAITAHKDEKRKAVFSSLPVFGLCMFSAGICMSPSFVTRDHTGLLNRGVTYYIYSGIGFTVYSICVLQTLRQMSVHVGIRRVELQFLALNAGGTALLQLGLNVAGNILNIRTLNRLSILLVLAASALTAAALLMHRVFNAREVFMQLVQRLWFAIILSGGIYVLWRATSTIFAEPFGLLFSVAVFGPVAVWLDKKTRLWLDVSGEKQLAQLRQSAIEIEHMGLNKEQLVEHIAALSCSRFETRSTAFLFDQGSDFGEGALAIGKDTDAHRALCRLGWATPESLDRRRTAAGTNHLKRFLEQHALGLLMPVPRDSATPTLLLALGRRPDDRPFTFPEIQRFQNLTDVIDNILIRSNLAAQAALQTRTDDIAMLARGVAHDLKNLITPISTYLIHIEGKSPANGTDAEVYASARRAVRVMTDYVRDTLSCPQRMEPRLEAVSVNALLTSVYEVMSGYGAQHNVAITCAGADGVIHCDRVLMQRMLGNLISNAVDASTPGQSVSIHANNLGASWRFEVHDHGCGIPSEYIGRIFEPYFTTKISANSRGFGLGLTIVHKIVQMHAGKIRVQSIPGQSTVVSVDLPGHVAFPAAPSARLEPTAS